VPGANVAGAGGNLLVTGIHHRSSPPDWGDRFAWVEAELDAALDELKGKGARDAVLLATCDRIEVISADDAAASLFVPMIARRLGIAESAVAASAYRHEGEAALKHLFAVASALDSQVIGEPQVLGQLRAAHRAASEQGLVGATLEIALEAAYAVARRIRRETRIAQGPVSLAAAALALARDIHGDLAPLAALLVGPSEMGELMAEQFRRAGLTRFVVCGPAERARQAARELGCNLLPLAELEDAVAAADIVIAALGSGRAILTRALVAAALKKRPLKPIFVIDTGMPADAEPTINDLDGAFLYDLADLERAALAGRKERADAAQAAWAIVDAEIAAHRVRLAARRAVPAVVALRAHVERLRDEALAAGGDAEAVTRRLVNRLLHDPSEALRQLAGGADEADAARMEDLVRRLFRLGHDEDGEGQA
jgi:glutamyl-tRNA reductase